MLPRHILIVEDDAVARELLRETLTGKGYKVTLASDGVDALARIREDSFDLVITDFAMPGLDGLALLTKVKRVMPQMRVILLTASINEGLINEAVRRGASGVASKPIGSGEILRMVACAFGDS